MNIVWTSCVLLSLLVLTVTSPQSVVPICVDSGSQAVNYALQLCGIYCLWLGVFGVAQKCNVVSFVAKLFAPLNKFLFGNIPSDASEYICINMSSNLLGIGNAATPSGISAISLLEKDNTTLSRAGAMLFVINACSLQLIPTTVIGLRATAGSANASDILLPTVITTAVTLVIGVTLVFVGYGKAQ